MRSPVFSAFLFGDQDFVVPEQQRDTPDTGQRNNGKNDPADHSGLSAEDPADDIKLEQTDGAPVDRSYDTKYKSYSVQHRNPSLVRTIIYGIGGIIPLEKRKNMENKLRFHNGRFRIMLVGDPHCGPEDKTKKDRNVLKDYLELQYAAIRDAKPDLAVLMGDNADGGNLTEVEKTLRRITKPYADGGVPFTFILGNHDLQYAFSELDSVYAIYKKLPCCILPDDRTEYGDFALPVFSEKNGAQALQVLCLYSGSSEMADKGTVYDCVLPQQLAWLKETQTRLGDVPTVLLQHIPVPEEFALLKESTPLSMLFDAVTGQNEMKGRFFRKKKTTDGYLGEAPCAPAVNSGEFETLRQCGNVFAAFFGHDHMNDFVGMTDGVILGQCKTASFNAYGDGTRQGVRILDFFEDAPYTLETFMLNYRDAVSPQARSLSGSIAVLHDKTSVKLETGAKALGAAAAAAAPVLLIAVLRKLIGGKR